MNNFVLLSVFILFNFVRGFELPARPNYVREILLKFEVDQYIRNVEQDIFEHPITKITMNGTKLKNKRNFINGFVTSKDPVEYEFGDKTLDVLFDELLNKLGIWDNLPMYLGSRSIFRYVLNDCGLYKYRDGHIPRDLRIGKQMN